MIKFLGIKTLNGVDKDQAEDMLGVFSMSRVRSQVT